MRLLDPEEWTITPRAASQALDLGMSPGFIVRLLTEPSHTSVVDAPDDPRELMLDGFSARVGYDTFGRKRVEAFNYKAYAPALGIESEAA